ncbi:histidine kinase dimerization/phospho-acceptor domain-containing protein, partial [Georgenia sp. 10Sc9-8]|nr:histidine kinase dimerization/phospho-acceptor domain-containing protein [Georgenia halotolerans]
MLLQKNSARIADDLGVGNGSRPEHLYAFLRQLPFAAVTVALVTAYIVAEPGVFDDQRVLIGLLVVLAATGLSLTLPWHRMDLRWAGALPLLDIAAIGLVQAGGVSAASLLVLPVLWMSRSYGAAGVVVSVTGGTVAAWSTELPVPDLSTLEVPDLQRLFLLPLILLAVGVYLHLAERRSSARLDLLGRQSTVLERTLAGSRDQQRLLTTILDTIDVGVLVVDEDGRVARTNRMHTSRAGGALDVGDRVDGGVPERTRGYRADGRTPLATEELSTWLADEARDHELVWWDMGDGERRAYRVTARRLPGSQRGTVIAYHDLTAEMGALAQLEDFVSSVSHELRTPLTSVLGYLDLALDDELPDRARGHLQVVERNAARLLRMIGDLLTAAQTRRGQLLVSRTPS